MIASLHREAVADRGLLAVASATKQKIVYMFGALRSEQGFYFTSFATAKQKRSKYQ